MSTVKLSKEAIAKLRIVQKQLVESPEFYNQDEFAIPTKCGTMCCIAGWLHYNEVGEKAHEAYIQSDQYKNTLRPEGSAALGLTEADTSNLFSGSYAWPYPFGEEMGAARSCAQRARIAVKRIEHFIETGE